MPFSRARYVTLCQQSLVTAAVLVVGVSAAGVRTLDIVPAPAEGAGAQAEALPRTGPALHPGAQETQVDVAPVTPKVREVAVEGIADRRAAQAPDSGDAEQGTRERRAPAAPAPQENAQENAQKNARENAQEDAQTGKKVVAVSEPTPATGYATVGVTWKHGVEYDEDAISIQVRTKTDGRWSGWTTADYHDDHGPDADTAEARGAKDRPGTDAVIVGDVDLVQMRAETEDGTAPEDLKLAVIDPGTGRTAEEGPAIDTAKLPSARGEQATTSSASLSSSSTQELTTTDGEAVDSAALSAMKVAPKPLIYSRAQWGANERLRDQSAPAYGTIKAGFIHHTVNANSYTSAQVPSLLRGIYAYHTQSRGWRDIGYNFLVDRFGRIWEGRWGGVDRAVVGAHTLGYNEYAFAMSAIGNFDVAQPPQAVSDAYARLFAWKLSLYGIRADATRLYVKNRYLAAINGHRDAGQTACPGRYLYAKIPAIRAATQALQNKAQTGGTSAPAPTPTPTPTTPPPSTTFSTPTQTPRAAVAQPGSITFPRGFSVGGSGYPDLLLKADDGKVRVLPTGGLTGFGAAVATPGSWSGMGLVAGVGDVTGDGRGDVVGRTSDGRSRVYAGIGYGKVSTSGTNPTTLFAGATQLVSAGDWNGDRKTDLLMVGGAGRTLYVVAGHGAGRFGSARVLSSTWGGMSRVAAVGDADGNGSVDLVGLSKGGLLYFYPGTSAGGIGAARAVTGAPTRLTGVAGAGDMTGDGRGDVAVRDASGRWSILAGLGGGAFSAPLGWSSTPVGLRDGAGAAMTGNAATDLVGTNATRTQVLVHVNNGRSNVEALSPVTQAPAGTSQVLGVGDWNRDGKNDVITREDGKDRLVLRRGLGGGQFAAGVTMSEGWRSFVNLVAVGDVTGDGRPDLLGRMAGKPFTIFPSNGTTGFQAPILAPASLRSFAQIGSGSWRPALMPKASFYDLSGSFVPFSGSTGGYLGWAGVVGPGDVDGDGRPDLVVQDSQGTLWLLPGTATGYAAKRWLAAAVPGYSLVG